MIENPRLARPQVVSFDRRTHCLRREHLHWHAIILVEHPRVLNPEWKLRRPIFGNGFAIENCARYARAMPARRHKVAHFVRVFSRQKTVRVPPSMAGCSRAVRFLYSAIDYANCRCVIVRRCRCRTPILLAAQLHPPAEASQCLLARLLRRCRGNSEQNPLSPSHNPQPHRKTIRKTAASNAAPSTRWKNLCAIESDKPFDFRFTGDFYVRPIRCTRLCEPATSLAPSLPSPHRCHALPFFGRAGSLWSPHTRSRYRRRTVGRH